MTCPRGCLRETHKAEIGNLDVAIRADEKVLRLEIAVNDILLVQVIEDEDQVRNVEASDVGREAAGAAEVRKEFAALDKLEEHVQVRLVLKGAEAARRYGTR